MLILIEKDPKNLIPREVVDTDEAVALSATFPVYVPMGDGNNMPLDQYLASTAIDMPKEGAGGPDLVAAELIAFEKSGLTEAKWKRMAKEKRDELIAAEIKG